MILRLVRSAGVTAAGAVAAGGLGYGLYLTVIGEGARSYLRASNEAPPSKRTTRFRVLIPAHNEQALIAETLDALLDLDYPNHLVEVCVVADNCSDRTADIAREKGASVYERHAPNEPGKGPALRWLIASLPGRSARDVIVILDADSLVERDFLSALSRQFENGADVVQGYYAVRDDTAGGEIGLRSAAFAVRHLVRPAGRVRLGGSSSLYGNGMAFTEEIARSFAWSAHLTEDLDMGLRLLLAGTKVGFEPNAVVRGEMPDTQQNALSQHQRWEAGRRGVTQEYTPRLLNAARSGSHGCRWAYLDAALDIAMPPLGTLVAASSVGTAMLALLGRGSSRKVGVVGGSVGIALLAIHLVMSLRMANVPPAVYRSLTRIPGNMVWKLRVLFDTKRSAPTEWTRTTRNSDVQAKQQVFA